MKSVRSCVLAVMVSVTAAGCAKRCEPSVDGISLSETFSFDLLRPMTATERATDASLTIDRIQVFQDRNEHWDLAGPAKRSITSFSIITSLARSDIC